MTRPKLTLQTTPDDFLSYYWLKKELISFLREHHLSTTGSKQELTTRISQFLATGIPEDKPPQKSAKRAKKMPKTFTRQSVIESGWRCSQELRAFFEREIGTHFHFDAVMRELIYNGAGKSLDEAIETWEEAQRNPVQEKTISPQFEYNRHIRAYFQAHPEAKLEEAIEAWNIEKKKRRSVKND